MMLLILLHFMMKTFSDFLCDLGCGGYGHPFKLYFSWFRSSSAYESAEQQPKYLPKCHVRGPDLEAKILALKTALDFRL